MPRAESELGINGMTPVQSHDMRESTHALLSPGRAPPHVLTCPVLLGLFNLRVCCPLMLCNLQWPACKACKGLLPRQPT